MPDIKQIFTFLEPDQGMLDGKSCNPWADASFNYCTLEPGADDFEEKAGIETTTIEKITTIIDKGSCYWKKIGSDIYYDAGDVLMGISTSPGEGRVTIQKPGTLGFNLDILELVNSAAGTNIIGTASSIVWYGYHEDTTAKSSRVMARITAGIETNWATTSYTLYTEVSRFGHYGTGSAEFADPYGICSDGSYLYISDTLNHRIIKRSLSDYSVVATVGTSGTGDLNFKNPYGIATDGFYLYICDTHNWRVKVHRCSDLSFFKSFGTYGSGNNNFYGHTGICIVGSTLYITDNYNHRIKKHNVDGTFIATYGSLGSGDAQFDHPVGLCSDGTYLYVIDALNNRIKKHQLSDLSYVAQVADATGTLACCYVDPYIYFAGDSGQIEKYTRSLVLVETSSVLSATMWGIILVEPYFFVTNYWGDDGYVKHGVGVLVGPGAIYTANVFNSNLSFSTTYQGITKPWVRISSLGYMGVGTLNPTERIEANGKIKTNNQFISSLAVGTKPIDVTSTTLCANLNADLWDNFHLPSMTGAANYVFGVDADADGLEYKQLIAGANITITHGVGSVTIAAGIGSHALLSATHSDTVADSVLAGDLIYGNATPKWARLAKGTDGNFLKMASGYPAWAAHGLTYSDVGAAASGHDHSGVYDPAGTGHTEASTHVSDHAALITGVHGLVFTAGKALTLTESLTLNALPVGGLAVATAANTLGSLAVGTVLQILVGGGAGAVPVWGTDLPTAVTIGSGYVYRAGGTDVPVADGGTGKSVFVVGDIVHATGTTTLAGLADVAVGSYLASGGVGVIPAWATLNQAAIPELTTASGPTFAHIHITDLAAIYTPAESWIGPSSTTGIYFKGGNVGIGTTSPGAKLDLSSTVGKKLLTYYSTNIYQGLGVDIYGGEYESTWFGSAGPSNTGFLSLGFYSHAEPPVYSEKVRIQAGGNVGIGTTNPKSVLHVVGLPVYANNAAAVAGGLTAGAFYRTGSDPDPVCVTH